ncbi:TetR/AcrR family transcriptional regulator [Actinomadura kijaniata]|uniref:TetR/AcrR family transcriptional regulator n=1 Tax=Actinomadura kijaniata TaxID=46161 RepID=UPI00082A034C|nr:helix-turn-helix domain-containing protein [Actinomadura kijaniata]
MARPRDPHRRDELLDATVDYLATNGLSTLSMRPLAEHLGHSTRVLTHHFADKSELLTAVLTRLDEQQRQRLRALPGWDGERGMGDIIRATWRWQLAEENLPFTRLVHEIEGLAAGGRLHGQVTRLLADRIAFVAAAFRARGVPENAALRYATLQNATFAGLQLDYLNTGDRERAEAGIEWLADQADRWIAEST